MNFEKTSRYICAEFVHRGIDDGDVSHHRTVTCIQQFATDLLIQIVYSKNDKVNR